MTDLTRLVEDLGFYLIRVKSNRTENSLSRKEAERIDRLVERELEMIGDSRVGKCSLR